MSILPPVYLVYHLSNYLYLSLSTSICTYLSKSLSLSLSLPTYLSIFYLSREIYYEE